MESVKDNNNEEYVIDPTVFRCYHTIDSSLITAEDFAIWKESPITKSLLKTLEYYCITPAMEFKDNGDVGIHIIGRFDIKKAILERERSKHDHN